MDCPKCGQKDLPEDECPACGIFVSKYLDVQARKKTCERPDDIQPIPAYCGYEGPVLKRFIVNNKKLIFAVLVLIILFGLILILQYAVNLVNHASTFTKLGVLIGILAGIKLLVDTWAFNKRRLLRKLYYHDEYLKSEEWRRKRSVVLKRDNHRCVYCGGYANQVHHKQYAPQNIGREPIEWLVSVCEACHSRQHGK